jgi:hypothetical protein
MKTERGDQRQILIVGDDPVGPAIARYLSEDVLFRGFDDRRARRVADDVRDVGVLDEGGTWSPSEAVDVAVVATATDSTNLLATQRLRLESDADIIVRLNDPTNRDAYAPLGVETVCVATNVGEQIAEQCATLLD